MCFVKLQRTWPFTTEIESVHPWVQADICTAFVETPPRRSWDIASTRKGRADGQADDGNTSRSIFLPIHKLITELIVSAAELKCIFICFPERLQTCLHDTKAHELFWSMGPWSWSVQAYSWGWMCFYTHTHTHTHTQVHSGRRWRLMNTLHRCTTTATVRVHAHVPASMGLLLKCCLISVLFVLLSADYGRLFSGLYVLWAWLQFDSGPACMCNHHNQNRNTPIRSAISLIAFN